MAEAAGLAVGVLALAGLFNDCVGLFAHISASRHLVRDYELLETKLDIEKTLLLQWSDRVQLLSERDYDRRLDYAQTRMAVLRILKSIRMLLSESGNLQHRYGMRPAANNDECETTALTAISSSRMARFVNGMAELSLRTEPRRSRVPLLNNIRWVVHERHKFDCLINNLSHFTSRLNDLVPESLEHTLSMMRQDLDGVRTLSDLKLVQKSIAGQGAAIAPLVAQCLDERCMEQILARLRFQAIDHREFNIVNPHYKTLQWALEPPDGGVEWDDLSDWLQSQTGIYWVSGKAGSGKSTLMKYLYHHDKTQSPLRHWAGSRQLTMANFYFWNLGTVEQKSQDGLGRSLLFRVLSEDLSLIPMVLPNMWQDVHASDGDSVSLPSCQQMREAIRLLGRLQLARRRFCFFIDGLDEYEGDYEDGISFIESLADSPSIKVVISSRPIPQCVQAFSSRHHLLLQDLTRQDIQDYVD